MLNKQKKWATLSRVEMKSVLGGLLPGGGGGTPPADTWLCDCGPNTTMDVYGANAIDAMSNYLMTGSCHGVSAKCVKETYSAS